MSKIIAIFLPFWRYTQLAILIGAFLAGGWIVHRHYQNQLEKIERESARAVLNYANRLIEADTKYAQDLKNYKQKVIVVTKEVQHEVSKPEYQCPVPDDGIRLLNSSINTANSRDNNK